VGATVVGEVPWPLADSNELQTFANALRTGSSLPDPRPIRPKFIDTV
jgi:hypothetical protein